MPAKNRQKIPNGIKMSILEGMCPPETERHLQLNRSRLHDFEDKRAELGAYLKTRATELQNQKKRRQGHRRVRQGQRQRQERQLQGKKKATTKASRQVEVEGNRFRMSK